MSKAKTDKPKKTPSKTYTFTLVGVNINKIDQKYGIISSTPIQLHDAEIIPTNTTKLDDLNIVKRTPEIVSFLDESKRLRKCTVSMIDFQTKKNLSANSSANSGKKYKCFWDRNFIPDNVQPIGCPIKYVPIRAVKTYISEISKEKYVITENVTSKKADQLVKKQDPRITLESKDYYLTDGAFCSFNCCMAYIQDQENKNSLHRHSESLLLKMYIDLHPEESMIEIVPAPHWRLLEEFGGHLDIERFREAFNKVSYTDHGSVCVSMGRLFEDQLKF